MYSKRCFDKTDCRKLHLPKRGKYMSQITLCSKFNIYYIILVDGVKYKCFIQKPLGGWDTRENDPGKALF